MNNLTYVFCDDWFIFAVDKDNVLYLVCTELWSDWLDCPKNADKEENAVEKYIFPIAKKRWNFLNWEKTNFKFINGKCIKIKKQLTLF